MYKIEIITMVTKSICTPLHLLLHLYTDSLDPSMINFVSFSNRFLYDYKNLMMEMRCRR